MKISRILLPFALLVMFAFSACNKKCKFDKQDSSTGDIVQDVIIYQQDNFGGMKVIIRGNSSFADRFQVSFDGGVTKQNIDYNTYNLINFPTTTKCDAVFTRDVKRIDADLSLRYNITFEDCDKCQSDVTLDNFVLVPAFPQTYTVEYTLN